MGFHSILERMGFVRLRDFGLILTPDRRVVTTRPILDDGFGATVVGWEGSDLAAMELPSKAPGAPAPLPPAPRPSAPIPVAAPIAVASPPAPIAVASPPAPPPVLAPAPVAVLSSPRPITVEVPAAPPMPLATPPAPTPAVQPRAEEEMTEDEWEWEIAMARARAEGEADTVLAPVVPAPPPVAKPRTPTPHTTSQWLTREPLTGRWQEDTAIRSVTQYARASEQRLAAATTATTTIAPAIAPAVATATPAPRTIIPVPTLPVAADPSRVRLDDVTRQLAVPRRIARGTSSRVIASDDTATAVRVRRSS